MKNHALAFAFLLLSTAAHAEVEAPGPYTLKRAQPGCQSPADFDRIMLMATNRGNELERARAKRAFAELAEGPTVRATEGRRCLMIPKGTVVTVHKRIGRYDCVRFKGQPPSSYDRTCVYTNGVTNYGALSTEGMDWYWLY
ncbi:hypothetical protein [Methylobacterium sp. AMS5]|uniref:hypothetical protein n=1 Tax=Methylobacterium sp. AMS5 TaxID=925818 RepID=UPI000B30E61D|nr:hypothetical protein [Methylobacterium sp. AMS5]